MKGLAWRGRKGDTIQVLKILKNMSWLNVDLIHELQQLSQPLNIFKR